MAGSGQGKDSPWMDDTTLTTIKALHEQLGMEPSRHHKPELVKEEEEILQHYKDWAFFNRTEFRNKSRGKEFYDIPDVMYFNIHEQTARPGFGHHFDNIDPYFDDAHIAYKDLEIVATSKDTGYGTMIQRYWGTGTDGKDFSHTFRMTSLLRKIDGKWKWIHEHVSFPADFGTEQADSTSGTGTKGKPHNLLSKA